MRKVEQQIIGAIASLQSGVFANTAITVESDGRDNAPHVVRVVLHASLIAQFNVRHDRTVSDLRITLAGYNTRITRSRLSLIIRHAAGARADAMPSGLGISARGEDAAGPYRYPSGLGISARGDVVRLHDARGETVIDADSWHKVEV